ncbi:tripartite tricarboxylate transporter TctB family protein [Anaeroselena agilis]|uniref:Tripartite tricarboxylate transporter TctB family protein n=1 Tax=Anaeroselena agilis TaxID=3063788 RepID=A0ABU3NUQ7_9FIRM|nr:tripartite tricarboxylate transporter TctB family protein [Selenomonadales bacterium 4137-cl]
MKIPDIIAGILGLALSVYVIYTAYFFPEDKVLLLGPSFFPTVLAIGLGIFSLMLLSAALRGKSRPSADPFSLKDPAIHRAGISLLAIIAYCLVLGTLGFIITSTVFLFGLMYLLKRRDYIKMAAVSIAVTLLVYGIFNRLLDISLPAGFLG